MHKAATAWQAIHNELAGSQEKFIAQLHDIESVQKKQLLDILKTQAATPFGQKYRFAELNSVSDFTRAVPIHSYADIHPSLETMAAQPGADIICLEQTSGSTHVAKLIPYTQHSFKAFQNALFPWLDDLLLHRPAIKKGSAYWSISPALRERQKTKGGLPIGIENDALYFGEYLAGHISQTLAVSAQIAKTDNLADWHYQTLYDLLCAEDLSFISVWSPSFLLELIQQLPLIIDKLLDEIHQLNPARAITIKMCVISPTYINTQKLWPALDTISCWADGSATSFITALQDLFPHAYIQGKGLIATEGVITLPLSTPAPVLAVCSGFYEFIDEQGLVKLAHQLEQDKVYQVVLTNYSGLYRYRLGDKVQVRGFFQQAPMLNFIGRGERNSDLCGEKLDDAFVTATLAEFKTLSGFRCLIPQSSPTLHYVLLTDENNTIDIQQVDEALSRNPQYQYARKMGQLQPLQHRVVKQAMRCYTQWHVDNAISLGDIKPPALITNPHLIRALS